MLRLHAVPLSLILASTPSLAADDNEAPEVDPQTFDTDEDKVLNVTIKARDDGGGKLEFKLTKAPKNGEATLASNGKLTFTPKKDWHGKDEIAFEVSDGTKKTAAKAAIEVSSVNDPPTATVPDVKGVEDKQIKGTVTAKDADGDPIMYAVVDSPGRSDTDIDPRNGKFVFTPAPNQNGTIKVMLRISDGTVDVNVPMNVVIEPVNDAPTADESDELSTKEDEPLKGKLAGTDLDGDAITFALIDKEKPAHGAVVIDAASGAFTYTPAKEYHGADGFGYTVSDGKANAKGKVTIAVQNVNDPPTLTTTNLDGLEDTPLKGKISAKDFDGDSIYYSVKLDPKHGEADIDHTTGELTYTPNPDFHGTETITVEASDIAGGVSAPVVVSVKPVNDPPAATGDATKGEEDQASSGKLKAKDVDGDALAFSMAKPPKNGTVEIKTDGTFKYTPNPNFNGTDSFVFEVTDGKLKAQADQEVNVKAVNDGPTTADVKITTNEDTPGRGTVTAADIDKDKLTWTLAKKSKKGKVEVDEEKGTFVYTPSPNENGDDAFSIKVSDGSAEAEANVSVAIGAVNDAPVAVAHKSDGKEDEPIKGKVAASDVDKDTLTWSALSKPKLGALELDASTGSYTFTPGKNANGEDGFRVEVSDGKLKHAVDVKLVVAAVNDAPDTKPVALAATEDKPANGAVAASDVDKDKLTWSEAKPPAKGKVVIDGATGKLTYTPNQDANGEDTFVVAIADGVTKSEALVTVSIAAVNDTPIAVAHQSNGKEDEPIKGKLAASDVDTGDTLTYVAATQPKLGKVEVDPATGAYVYTPNPHANGEDGFRFEVTDSGKLKHAADVKLTVAAVNDVPDTKPVALPATEDKPASGAVAASDIDKDKLTWSESKPPSKGKVALDAATGKFTYTPNLDENGEDTFVVSIADGVSKSDATVTVTIAPVNDAPIAVPHQSNGSEDAPIKGKLAASDVDKDALTYVAVSKPRFGTVDVDAATGAYTYTPNAHANGEDGFRFEVSDPGKLKHAADVKLVVAAVNDTPEPKELAISATEDREAGGKIVASDIDKDTLTFKLKKPAANGVVIVDDATGAFRYMPARNVSGKDAFVIEASDGFATADATVTVDVAAASDAPVVDPQPLLADEDATATVKLVALDADPGEQVTFKVVGQPKLASAEVEADGRTLKITPRPDVHGEDALVVEATDGKNKVKATLPVLIAAKNDPPTMDAAAATTNEEASVEIPLVAHDKDGDFVKLALDVKKENAKHVALAGHVATVTPPKDFAGTIEFNVVPADPWVKGDALKVVVTVVNVNDAPVAKDLSLKGVNVSGTIEASDVDAGDELTFSVSVPPRQGAVTLSDPKSGKFTYTAAERAKGEDSFRIRVKDKAGASVSATVHVTLGMGAGTTAPAKPPVGG